jgi:NitT/TauT family transport system substrate-binding protein
MAPLGTIMDRRVLIAGLLTIIILVAAVAAALMLNVLTLNQQKKGGTVYYITVAPKDMSAWLASGKIDGYIAWEPYVSDSVVGDVGSVIEWSGQIIPNHPCCVIAVDNSFLAGADGPALAARFVRAHIDATNWMNDALSHPSGANYTLLINMAVQFTQRNASVVEEAFTHIKYDYVMDAHFSSILEQFTNMYISNGMVTNQTLAADGYSSPADFVNSYVNGTYLAAAADVAPVSGAAPIRLGYLLGDLHQMAQVVAQNTSILADGKSMFQEYGLSVTDAAGAPFANGGAEMTAFQAGSVDIGYLGAAPAILNHLNTNVPTTIISQVNSEGSGIVVKAGSGITDLSGLVNKTVATPGEPTIQFLLLKYALQKDGIDLKLKP